MGKAVAEWRAQDARIPEVGLREATAGSHGVNVRRGFASRRLFTVLWVGASMVMAGYLGILLGSV